MEHAVSVTKGAALSVSQRLPDSICLLEIRHLLSLDNGVLVSVGTLGTIVSSLVAMVAKSAHTALHVRPSEVAGEIA